MRKRGRPVKGKDKLVQIDVCVSQEEKTRATKLAKKTHAGNRSKLIRTALVEYMDKETDND
jgi:hypothetical protein